MRSKEVDDAINIVSNVRTGLMNFNELINEHKDIIDSVEKVLNYISELEEENEKYKNFQLHISGMRSGKELLTRYIKDSILKDTIRDKIEELEKLNFNNYANEYDDGNEVKNYILKKFKELLGEQ